MITKQQALTLGYGAEVHYTGRHDCTRTVGPRGGVKESITACRVTGSIKTWKTRPAEFRLPVKYGLREYAAINHYDAGEVPVASDCPLNQTADEAAP